MQKRLERLELEHLRQHALDLYEQLENAKAALSQADDRAYNAEHIADFWQQQVTDLQDALADENFATHRCIGITKAGEMMVVKQDTTPSQGITQ